MANNEIEICWDKHYAEVNAWRGECMHHIAAAEKAATDTLLLLDSVKPDGGKIKLRHLIGQRFEDLSAATGPDGPFAEAGEAAHKAMEITVSMRCFGPYCVTASHRLRQREMARGC